MYKLLDVNHLQEKTEKMTAKMRDVALHHVESADHTVGLTSEKHLAPVRNIEYSFMLKKCSRT